MISSHLVRKGVWGSAATSRCYSILSFPYLGCCYRDLGLAVDYCSRHSGVAQLVEHACLACTRPQVQFLPPDKVSMVAHVIPALRSWRQEDHKFEVIPSTYPSRVRVQVGRGLHGTVSV